MADEKGLKDVFADFFEDPSRESLRALLEGHFGETRYLDFKTEWPDNSALAKQCLGLANTEGGCLIIGVQEQADKSLEPVGLTAFKDKADIVNGLKNHVPGNVLGEIAILDFTYDTAEYAKIQGKKFQALIVSYDVTHTPAVSLKAGTGIRKGAIYFRHEGITEEISADELQSLIAKRLRSEQKSVKRELKHHLDQLKVLYETIPKYVQSDWGGTRLFSQNIRRLMYADNPLYPKEDYEQFVARLVTEKKELIERELGTAGD